MNECRNSNWFPPVDLTVPPPGRPPGFDHHQRPPSQFSLISSKQVATPDLPIDIPPPGWNSRDQIIYEQKYQSSALQSSHNHKTKLQYDTTSNTNNAAKSNNVPNSSKTFDEFVSNPYYQPQADGALRQRAFATRLEWMQNPDLQNKFSDSEFSDASVASTDAFVRTAGFRHGNADSRQRKLDAMNGRSAPNGGDIRHNGDYTGRGNNSNKNSSIYNNFNTNNQDDVGNGSTFPRGMGRGMKSLKHVRPGASEARSSCERETNFLQSDTSTRRYGGDSGGHSDSGGDGSDKDDDKNDANSFLRRCATKEHATPQRATAEDLTIPQISYSLNTDIRNAQDVTSHDSISGVAHEEDYASEAPSRRGRRFVAAAHKRYRVVGRDDAMSGKQRASLDALIVQLTSKAKRQDALGREYYIRDEIMPFDEDQRHEFKGHRSMAYDEQPEKTRATASKHGRSSRKPVSVALNAFLNSQSGGIVFLGVLDTGGIKGLMLTSYQKDHVRGQVEDLFSRYQPPVPSHRYKLSFVPVLEGIDLETEIATLESYDKEPHNEMQAKKRHKFRTPHYCWCDKDAVALLEFGRIPSQFLIEIEIFGWDPKDPRNPNPFGTECPNIAPTHEDEVGRVYFRRNASNYCPLVSEIIEYAKHQVDKYYLDLLERFNVFEDVEENDGDDEEGASIFDDTARDRLKSRLGLNVMEKTIKSMKRNGTWDRQSANLDEGDTKPLEEDLMLMEDSNLKSCNSEHESNQLVNEVDKLLLLDDELDASKRLEPRGMGDGISISQGRNDVEREIPFH